METLQNNSWTRKSKFHLSEKKMDGGKEAKRLTASHQDSRYQGHPSYLCNWKQWRLMIPSNLNKNAIFQSEILQLYSWGFNFGAQGGCLPNVAEISSFGRKTSCSLLLYGLGWLYMEMENLIWQGCQLELSAGLFILADFSCKCQCA